MRFLAVFALFVVLACLQACVAVNSPAGTIANPELHALMSSRIEVQLTQIEALLLEQQLTEPEREAERQLRAARIADAAQALQQSATRLQTLQADLGLSPEQQPGFAGLVAQLQAHGNELEELARTRRYAELTPAMERARATCNACHALYRGR